MLGGGVVLFFEMGGGVVLSVNPRTRKLNFDGQEEGEDTPMHIQPDKKSRPSKYALGSCNTL
jgi:hypothetical protein